MAKIVNFNLDLNSMNCDELIKYINNTGIYYNYVQLKYYIESNKSKFSEDEYSRLENAIIEKEKYFNPQSTKNIDVHIISLEGKEIKKYGHSVIGKLILQSTNEKQPFPDIIMKNIRELYPKSNYTWGIIYNNYNENVPEGNDNEIDSNNISGIYSYIKALTPADGVVFFIAGLFLMIFDFVGNEIIGFALLAIGLILISNKIFTLIVGVVFVMFSIVLYSSGNSGLSISWIVIGFVLIAISLMHIARK